MRLIERYILARTVRGFLATIGGLTATVWLFQFLNSLDVVTSQGQTIWTFFVMTILALPAIVQTVIPFAFLIGATLALNGLNADGELAAVAGAGGSRICTLRPILILSVALMVLLVASYHVIAPASLSGLRILVTRIRADVIANFVQDGSFRTFDGGVTLHIREKMPDGSFRGVFLSDSRRDGDSTQFIAERGLLMEQGFRTLLLLEKGSIVHATDDGASAKPARDSVVTFSTYALDLGQFGSTAAAAAKYRISERTTPDLLVPPPGDRIPTGSPAGVKAELHTRFSAPLYAPGFALICLGLLGQVRSRRDGRGWTIATVIALCVVLRTVSFAVGAAVPARPSLAVFLYVIPLVTMAVGLGLVIRSGRTGSPTRRGAANGSRFGSSDLRSAAAA